MATGDIEKSVAAMEFHLKATWECILKIYEEADAAAAQHNSDRSVGSEGQRRRSSTTGQ
jgi:hypothetical protein